MAHRVVKQPNGRYAIFSTVCDDVIAYGMTAEELTTYYVQEAADKARAGIEELLSGKPDPVRWLWSAEEILVTIRARHGGVRAVEIMALLTKEY